MMALYSQRDSRWAHQRLGTQDGATIGGFGCYVSSLAMAASNYGIDINPSQLDDIFTANEATADDPGKPYRLGGYVDNDLCWDGMLSKVYDKFEYVGAYHCENNPCDLNQLAPYDVYGMEAIIEVDFDHNPTDGIQTHFVRMFAFNNGDPIIDDPWFGDRVRFSTRYGNPADTIQKVVFYKVELPSAAPVVTTVPVQNVSVEQLNIQPQPTIVAPSEPAPMPTPEPAPALEVAPAVIVPNAIPAPVVEPAPEVPAAPTYSPDLQLFEEPTGVIAPNGSTVVEMNNGKADAVFPAGRHIMVIGYIEHNNVKYLQTENLAKTMPTHGLPASDFELYVPKTTLDGITPPTPQATTPAQPSLEETISATSNKFVRLLTKVFHHINK